MAPAGARSPFMINHAAMEIIGTTNTAAEIKSRPAIPNPLHNIYATKAEINAITANAIICGTQPVRPGRLAASCTRRDLNKVGPRSAAATRLGGGCAFASDPAPAGTARRPSAAAPSTAAIPPPLPRKGASRPLPSAVHARKPRQAPPTASVERPAFASRQGPSGGRRPAWTRRLTSSGVAAIASAVFPLSNQPVRNQCEPRDERSNPEVDVEEVGAHRTGQQRDDQPYQGVDEPFHQGHPQVAAPTAPPMPRSAPTAFMARLVRPAAA